MQQCGNEAHAGRPLACAIGALAGLPAKATLSQNDSLSLALPNITGVEDGSRRQVSFTRSSEKHQLMPAADLGVSGGAGEFNWYINGHYHYHSKANQTVRHPFKKSGRYEIVVVDEQGQTDRRSITIEERQR